jgi:hypothetical protein
MPAGDPAKSRRRLEQAQIRRSLVTGSIPSAPKLLSSWLAVTRLRAMAVNRTELDAAFIEITIQ